MIHRPPTEKMGKTNKPRASNERGLHFSKRATQELRITTAARRVCVATATCDECGTYCFDPYLLLVVGAETRSVGGWPITPPGMVLPVHLEMVSANALSCLRSVESKYIDGMSASRRTRDSVATTPLYLEQFTNTHAATLFSVQCGGVPGFDVLPRSSLSAPARPWRIHQSPR